MRLRDILREMPEGPTPNWKTSLPSHRHVDDIPSKMISQTATHQYWVAPKHVQVSDLQGNVQIGVTGVGEYGEYFEVNSVLATDNRTIKYYEAITHLVLGGHFPTWGSDNIMTRAAIETYRKLVTDKRLRVTHVPYDSDEIEVVTPDNFDSFLDPYNDHPDATTQSGWFVVRKA